MVSKFLKASPLFLILLGCGKKYDYIAPRAVATIQVNFKDQSGSARNIISLYSVPDKYSPERTWPLVVVLHGYGDNEAAFHDLWKSHWGSFCSRLKVKSGRRKGDTNRNLAILMTSLMV